MKKNLKKLVGIGVAAALCMSFVSGCGGNESGNNNAANGSAGEETKAKTESRELSLSIGNPEGSDNWDKYSAFVDAVNELSDGTLTVKIYASGTLATDQDALQALIDGTVDIAHVIPSAAAGTIPDISVLDLPGVFTYKSVDDAESLIDFESALHDTLDSIYADYGLKYLAMNQATQAALICNEKQITKPEDCQGMAFRTSGQNLGKVLEAWGASATTLDMSDLTSALERNMIQGTLTAYGVVGSNKLYEVAPYITYFKTTNNVASMIMSGATWDSLTEEQQGWITEASKVFMEKGPAIGASYYEKYRSEFEENGAYVYDLSEEEEAAFLEPVNDIYEQLKETSSEKGIQLIEQIEEWNAKQ